MDDIADPGQLSRFKQARALVITWKVEDDKRNGEKGTQEELEEFKRQATDLAEQLSKQQNTEVETFEIGPVKSSYLARQRLEMFLEKHDGGGTLLIIYYGGHATVNRDEELVWLREKSRGINKPWEHLPHVNWNVLQKAMFFQDCFSRVLFLLDCCYAGASAPSSPAAGIVESVVAVGFENVAPLQGRDSFTAALTKLLIDCQKKGDSYYASRLSTVLNAELRLGRRREQNKQHIRRTPHHMDFHGTKAKIWIGALKRPKEAQGTEHRVPKSTLMPDLPVHTPEKPSFIRLFQLNHFIDVENSRIWGDLVKYNRHNCLPIMSFNAIWVMATKEEEDPPKLMVNSLVEEKHAPWTSTLAPPPFDPEEYLGLRTLFLPTAEEDYQEKGILELEENLGLRTLSLPAAKESYQEMEIQPNLYRILDSLDRSQTSQSHIWIHDLCVIPNDPADNSAQARLTAEIFEKAENFILFGWLDTSTEAMGQLLEFTYKLNKDAHFIDQVIREEARFLGERRLSSAWITVWDKLVDLLKDSPLQYRRVFVGLILCKSCRIHVSSRHYSAASTMCNGLQIKTIDLQAFFAAVTLLSSRYDELARRLRDESYRGFVPFPSWYLADMRELAAYKALSVINAYRMHTSALDLETLVCRMPTLQVSDPRDVIYDFLPLAADCKAWRIDYAAPVAEIYQDFVRHCVTQSKSIDIICRPWAPRDTSDGLAGMPSWICQAQDTRGSTHDPLPRTFVGMPGKRLYKVSGDSKAAAVFQYLRTTFMTCSGFVLGPIITLSVVSQRGILPAQWLKTFMSERQRWRLLVADRGPDGASAPSWYHSAYSYWEEQYRTHRANWFDTDDVWQERLFEPRPPSTALEYREQARTVIRNRRLFTLRFLMPPKSGTLSHSESSVKVYGLCPEKTEENDLVCVLYGCSVPVVLRKADRGHMLIGECFILNFMDGEAMEIGKQNDGSTEFDIY